MVETLIEKHHFTLTNVRPVAQMQGRLWELEHPKSGAKLCWLDRPDENMTFSIGFRTIPTDSTGVFHILEHSVLGGSEKYPVKEPFVELLKSSLQTFLNAMTFPDKTVYPVSSRNKKDFHNLVGIYMDAVLHPLAVKDPNVFRQEGWRVEMTDDGQPMYQGVVYNEMKGAFSDVRSVLEHTMMGLLYPDSCYRHESGGDPAHIPELTYEQFCSEHAKYYHPSNALIVLDGQIDLDDTLGQLDAVLGEYDRQDMVFPIPMQADVPHSEHRVEYEIGAQEDPAGKTIVSYGRMLCSFRDTQELYAASILADYLAGGTEAPLKRAVLEAGLGADLEVGLHDGMQQAWFGWKVWNTDEEKKDAICTLIRDTVSRIADEGLDSQRLLGCYNSMAFHLLDRDGSGYPRGLMEIITVLETWLYGGDPAQNLCYRRDLDALREQLDTGYFEDLLRRCFLEDSTGVLVTMVPSTTLGAQRAAQEQQRVTAFWNGLTEDERTAMTAELDRLHTWQQTPDSEQALATIPVLSLEDITDAPKPLDVTCQSLGGTPVLVHKTDNDLIYVNLFFDASDLTPEQLPAAKLLTSLMGVLSTADHTGAQLQTAIKQKIGSLSFDLDVIPQGPEHHRMLFAVRGTCLPDSGADMAALMTEILTATRFTETDRLADCLRQKRHAARRSLVSGGHVYATTRAAAQQTSAGAAREYLSGCEYLTWIRANGEPDETGLQTLLAQIGALAGKLLCRDRMTVSVSENARALAGDVLAAFAPAGQAPVAPAAFAPLPHVREGIVIPGGVGYAGGSVNLERLGAKFHGGMYVLSNLLSFQYLWSEIRVKGGAYGSGFRGNAGGDVTCYSFRDPSPARSLEHFEGCAAFANEFCQDDPDLTKFILGALSDTDPLLGASGRIRLGETRYFRGTTQEQLELSYQQLRSATAADIRAICDELQRALPEFTVCVVGGRDQLEACGSKLDVIRDILN